MRKKLAWLGWIVAACNGESGTSPDAAPRCVEIELRERHTIVASGTVIDHQTGAPVAGATVGYSTAWDSGGFFPACPALAEMTTDADGRFGPVTIETGSSREPPISIFLVTGGGRAPTASDRMLSCPAVECDPLDLEIAAPSDEIVQGWRDELVTSGLDATDAEALTVYEFREADGTPAAGVVPDVILGSSQAPPVRFLEADRRTLSAPDVAATTASGVAIVAQHEDARFGYVAGRRDALEWEPVGVLFASGWIFVEDSRPSPP